jgi:hypothetical protein
MGARPYSPNLGRFLSVDPIDGGCANSYTYIYGDPINKSDLTGKWWVFDDVADWWDDNACAIASVAGDIGTIFAVGAAGIALIAFAASTGGAGAVLLAGLAKAGLAAGVVSTGASLVEWGAGVSAGDRKHAISGMTGTVLGGLTGRAWAGVKGLGADTYTSGSRAVLGLVVSGGMRPGRCG